MQKSLLMSLWSFCFITLFATRATSAPPPTPAQCVSSLACQCADFNLMPMSDRLVFIQTLESQRGPTFNASTQWRNIEAIITFFHDNQLGAPGSWISYTDCGILEGIERGFAIALGLSTDTFGNPCANLWAAFLVDLGSGKLVDRPTHDNRWSIAEQSCTDYGANIVAPMYHAMPSNDEALWFKFSQLYRWVLRNEGTAIDALKDIPNAGALILWFTDVSNFDATRNLAQSVWDFSRAANGLLQIAVGAAQLLLYAPVIVSEWLKETGGH